MDAPAVVLFMGDPHRCERALGERELALRAVDPTVDRLPRFADEVDVASLDTELHSASLFALARHVVIRGVERVKKPKAWADLAAKEFPAGTYVSFVAGPDVKASHLVVKACRARSAVVELPAPPAKLAAQTARGVLGEFGLRPSPAVVENLVARTGTDLLAMASEARKLRAFAGNQEIHPATVESLVFPGGEPTVYPFFDRLGERDMRAALVALDELREDAGRLLGGAVRHLARLTMVRALLEKRVPQGSLAERLSVQPWLVERLARQAKRFTLAEATAALDLGIRLDTEVKSGGRSAPDALLDLVLYVTSAPPPTPARG